MAPPCLSRIVFFDTELKFDAKRLSQILTNRYSFLYNSDGGGSKFINVKVIESFLERIIIKRPTSSKELLNEILALEETVISCNVKLIVIDSMAALVRKEGTSQAEKDAVLFQQAAELRRIADLCGCVVLVTNQVVGGVGIASNDQQTLAHQPMKRSLTRQPSLNLDVMDEDGGGGGGNNSSAPVTPGLRRDDMYSQYKPALGTGWFHCVAVRLYLDWQHKQELGAADIPTENRRLSLIKSPYSTDNFDMEYKIDNFGFNVFMKR